MKLQLVLCFFRKNRKVKEVSGSRELFQQISEILMREIEGEAETV